MRLVGVAGIGGDFGKGGTCRQFQGGPSCPGKAQPEARRRQGVLTKLPLQRARRHRKPSCQLRRRCIRLRFDGGEGVHRGRPARAMLLDQLFRAQEILLCRFRDARDQTGRVDPCARREPVAGQPGAGRKVRGQNGGGVQLADETGGLCSRSLDHDQVAAAVREHEIAGRTVDGVMPDVEEG